jgi:hypothetical protein
MNIVFETHPSDRRENLITCTDRTGGGHFPRVQVSALTNTSIRLGHMPYKTVFNCNTSKHFNSENFDEGYVIPVGVNVSPTEWAGSPEYYPEHHLSEYDATTSLFEYLNPRYLHDLQRGKAIFMIDQSLEGYHYNWLFDYFHGECKKYNIPAGAIVYITGNMEIDVKYEKWADQKGLIERIKCIPYAGFEEFVFTTAMHKRGNSPISFEHHLTHKADKKINTFNILQKRPRLHRCLMYYKLHENNLLDNALCSMDKPWSDQPIDHIGNFNIDHNKWNDMVSTLPRYINDVSFHTEDYNHYITRLHPEYCLNSWVSVVSEPQFFEHEDTVFTSEKIFKPIAMRHPFISFANKGHLKALRKLGYKTFSDFWDESYDEMDDVERLDEIIRLIKEIESLPNKLEWFKSMEEVLEHNFETLCHNATTPNPALVELENYSKSYFNE